MTDESSKTAQNSIPGKPFKKGDPRINRRGRPTTFGGLRELAQQIAHEKAKKKDGTVITADGHALTIAEAILRQWAVSQNPKLQQLFIEVSYGKVPNVTQLVGAAGGPVQIVGSMGVELAATLSRLSDEALAEIIAAAESAERSAGVGAAPSAELHDRELSEV